jgi:hypothetical protein
VRTLFPPATLSATNRLIQLGAITMTGKWLFRAHHLLKTFWTGPHGWRDQQHPDGTEILSGYTPADACE